MIKQFKLCTIEEKELLTRLVTLQLAAHRHICLNVPNYKKHNAADGYILDLLTKKNDRVTCQKACANLLDSYTRYSRQDWRDEFLIEKINKLLLDINNSSLKDKKILSGSYDKKESELSQYYLLTFLSLNNTVSITTASERLDIPSSTIKNACQDRRLKNVEKEGKYWRVNLDECANLWGKDINRREVLMPYTY